MQTISFLGWLKNEKSVYGPFLVVVPLSTMAAWQREFARWLPDMNVVTYVGDASSRELIRRYEFAPSPRARKTAGVDVRFHVLLSTPELVMMDRAHLCQLRYAVVAVDEAHRLKNEESSLHRTLAEFRSANRLLITGTPLQNSIRELWALLHFLTPEEFASAADFEEQFSFSALREPETVAALHMALRPYVLRRQKGDVEKSLPRKTYAVLRVGMASTQQQYYRWILTRNFSKLNAAAKSGGRSIGSATSLLNIVMELKKCCNHPYLFDGVEDSNASDAMTALIRASGKMILLDKLLLRLRDAGHRVLIFSQMVRMLDILQDYCRMRGFACQRLDGSMPNDLRQRAVDHYNAPGSNDFAFLLSTRAGGLGINLATADTVIIFDSDWNPQNDLQAESRAHRIGQTRDVKVFRLLSRDTVEEDILERAKRKRVLEHLVIHGVERGEGEASAVPKPAAFRKEELSAILRFGAEQLFKSGAVDGAAAPPGAPADVDGAAAAGPAPAGPATGAGEKPLEMDDIDEVLQRVPAENDAADGAGGGTMGDSLLNAFKWADFATTEEPDVEAAAAEAKAKKAKDKARLAAESAASRLTALESSQKAAKQDMEQREAADKELLGKEGDNEFWGRVIPRDLQEDLVASQLYLAPRSRKRVKHYAKDHGSDEEEDSDSDGEVADVGGVGDAKRRGGSGSASAKTAAARGRGKGRKPAALGGASAGSSGAKPPRGGKGGKRGAYGRSRGDISDQGDEELTQERRLVPHLSAKEVRALVKSLRKFGVASRAQAVVVDAGLANRVSVDDARRLLESVLARAHRAVERHGQLNSAADADELGMANGGSPSTKPPKTRQVIAPGTKRARVASGATPTIVVGREVMNASEMVVREAELIALATAVGGYPSETQFRLRAAAKPPAYGVKWTTINDAMLLVGILRHGLGNWKLIATDGDLGLGTKLSTPDSPVVGAPDTPKVVRRALTLLRSVSASVAASSRAAARVAAGKSKAAAAARKRAAAHEKAAAEAAASRLVAGGKRAGAKGRGKAVASEAARPSKGGKAKSGRKVKAVRGARAPSPDCYDDDEAAAAGAAGDKSHPGDGAPRKAAAAAREQESPPATAAPASADSAEESPEEGEVTTRRPAPVAAEAAVSVVPPKNDGGDASDSRSQCLSMSSAGKSASVKARARAVFGQSHSLKTMKELKHLSDTGLNVSMDRHELVNRTKACLVQLGDDIVAAGIAVDTTPALELWCFLAKKCHTALAGVRLQTLYCKLKATFPRDGSRGLRASAVPATSPPKAKVSSVRRSPSREPPGKRRTASAVSLSPSHGSHRTLVPSKRQRSGLDADKVDLSASAPNSGDKAAAADGKGSSPMAAVNSPPPKRAAVERSADAMDLEREAQADLVPRGEQRRSASPARPGSPPQSLPASGFPPAPGSPRREPAAANGGGATRKAAGGSGSGGSVGSDSGSRAVMGGGEGGVAASVGGGRTGAGAGTDPGAGPGSGAASGALTSAVAAGVSSERRSPRREERSSVPREGGRARSVTPESRRPHSRGGERGGGGGSAGRDYERDRERRHRSRDGSRDVRERGGGRDHGERDRRGHGRSDRDGGRERERERERGGSGRERTRDRERDRDRPPRDGRASGSTPGGGVGGGGAGSSSRRRDERDGHASTRDGGGRGRGEWERDAERLRERDRFRRDSDRGRSDRGRHGDGRKRDHRSADGRERERERDRDRDREREPPRGKRSDEPDRHRDRESDRHRDRERLRDRDRGGGGRFRDGRERDQGRSYGSGGGPYY